MTDLSSGSSPDDETCGKLDSSASGVTARPGGTNDIRSLAHKTETLSCTDDRFKDFIQHDVADG